MASPPPPAHAGLPVWKRLLDIVFLLAALPLFAICTLVLAIMMQFLSRGPLFFRQERVGYRGQRFWIYKFRTMHVNAEVASHQAHFAQLVQSKEAMKKLDGHGDTRLIPGGWLLRATGLDELPQLVNVVRREMSVVGPRPCIPYEYNNYTASQRARFESVPGLTGLWQVSGKNNTTFDEMIRLDVAYGSSKSFWGDVKIMISTPAILLGQLIDTSKSRRTALSVPFSCAASSHSPAPTSRSNQTTPSLANS